MGSAEVEALREQLSAAHAELEDAYESVKKLEEERDVSRRNAQQVESELERQMQRSLETKSYEQLAREEAVALQRKIRAVEADTLSLKERLAREEIERALAEGEVAKLNAGLESVCHVYIVRGVYKTGVLIFFHTTEARRLNMQAIEDNTGEMQRLRLLVAEKDLEIEDIQANLHEERRRSENMLSDLRMQVAHLRSSAHHDRSSHVDNNPVEAEGEQISQFTTPKKPAGTKMSLPLDMLPLNALSVRLISSLLTSWTLRAC